MDRKRTIMDNPITDENSEIIAILGIVALIAFAVSAFLNFATF